MLLYVAWIHCSTVLAQHSLYSFKFLSCALQNETLLQKMKHSEKKKISAHSNVFTEKVLLQIFLLCNKSNVVREWLVTNNVNGVVFMVWNETIEFHIKKCEMGRQYPISRLWKYFKLARNTICSGISCGRCPMVLVC